MSDITSNCDFTLGVDLTATALVINSNIFDTTAGDFPITVTNDFTIAASGVFVPNASTVTCSGNFDSSAGTITNGHLAWSLVLDGTGEWKVVDGQNFFNVTCAASDKTTTMKTLTQAVNDDFNTFGQLTLGGGSLTDTLGASGFRITIKGSLSPIMGGSTFANVRNIDYAVGTADITGTTYGLFIAVNSGPASRTMLGDIVISSGTMMILTGVELISDGYNITAKTVTNSGTLTLNTNAAPRQTTVTFPDIAGAGFGTSTGALVCVGTAGQGITITSAGAPPTNYWDFATTMSITADYTTIEYYVTGETSGTVDIDNCTFQLNESNSGFEIGVGGTLTSFTDNILDQCAGDEAFSSLVAHNAFDNIVITNNSATEDIRAGDVLLEFNNSNFDITAVDLDTSGNIISRNHNDVTDDYKVAATTLTYSNINTEPTETSNMRLYEGTWNFDYDDAENKACLTFKVDAGTTVKAEDHVDFYIINLFDLIGTWNKSAGYAGIFHIGQPTWDGAQWIDWKNWIGEPFIDFVQWLEFDI